MANQQLNSISFDELHNKITNGIITYDNVYSLDLTYKQHFAIEHYKKGFDTLDIDQECSIAFIDIEVFRCHAEDPDISNPNYPINSITLFSTDTCEFYSYYLLLNQNKDVFNAKTIETITSEFEKELYEAKYIKSNEKINIYLYDNEIKLITDCWKKIHDLDPMVLSGFYFDTFDMPFMYERIKILFAQDMMKVNNIFSKFGVVDPIYNTDKSLIDIVDYSILDLAHLYKTRDEGGLNYGKKSASYSLDFISEEELGLKKLEYKDKGLSLDDFYIQDPINFLKYNIVDVALTVRLNDKLQHVGLHNMIRRDMVTPMSPSMIGPAMMFDTYFSFEFEKDNTKVKSLIKQETELSIGQEDILLIRPPKSKSFKQTITEINSALYRKIINKFPGAYVKEGYGKLIDSTDGIHIDLDASLPPWERILIKRNNNIYYLPIGDYIWVKGDFTLTWDETNNICWREVTGKTDHDWDGSIIEIITNFGRKTTVTNNHSIFGIKQNIINDEIFEIDADQLEVGDYVYCYKKFDEKIDKYLIPDNLTQDIEICKYINEDRLHAIYTDTMNLEEIKMLNHKQYKGKVYDISVIDTSRFFAGTGIGVHNTALYPSTMMECNISIDTFFGRVIDPNCYLMFEHIASVLGTPNTYATGIEEKIFEAIDNYIEKAAPQNKGQEKQYYYYIIMNAMRKIKQANITIDRLLKPSNKNEYLILKIYLLPLLDMLARISAKAQEYNSFAYSYMINDELPPKLLHIYVLENANSPSIQLKKLDVNRFKDYLVETEVCFNLAGCLFYTHEKSTGMLTKFITNRLSMRKEYKNIRDTFTVGSDQYNFNNHRQDACKRNANTSYGLTGMSNFRFSNVSLACSTTISGRLSLKIAQMCAEMYINNVIENQ